MQRIKPLRIQISDKINYLFLVFIIVIINYSCTNNTKCKNLGHDGNLELLKVTWFIEPVRTVENFGVAFDNTTMVFLKNKNSPIEIKGDYCFLGNTILFYKNGKRSKVEKISILNISRHKLTLQFKNGEIKTYFNP